MGKLAVELNDAGIVIADESGVLAVEPGYAFLERGRIRTGQDAVSHARREPRRASNRFWSGLSVEPGSAGLDGPTSTAELAYAQLKDLWTRFGERASDVLLVVPGSYRGAQLGIALGLAQECGMPVRALVDTAAAASVRPYPGKQLLHVDASLHRIASTSIDQREEAFVRAEHELPTTGLANITEAFARRFAETFMLATRFNPFHRAETEQQLYDHLPEWLAAFHERGEIECVLRDGAEEFRTTVGRDAALSAVGGFYRSVVQLIAHNREPGSSLVVLLSQRLAALPGFVEELARLDDARIERLEPGHAALSALLAADELPAAGGDVKLVKHLRWRAPAAPEVADAAPNGAAASRRCGGAAAPTHVVYRGMVYPVDGRGLVVGREPVDGRRTIVVEGTSGVSRAHCELVARDGELRVVDLSRFGTFVNEKRVAGETVLARADVIRVGSPGAELEVVSMEPPHGA
jgi:hypothetical protein